MTQAKAIAQAVLVCDRVMNVATDVHIKLRRNDAELAEIVRKMREPIPEGQAS